MYKFPAGPYRATKSIAPTDGEYDYAIIASFDGQDHVIAEVYGRVDTNIRPDAEAIARLFKAAPDMHALLTEFVQRCDKGKIRSNRTYNKFKTILKEIEDI